MTTLKFTTRFEKSLQRLDPASQKAVAKALRLLLKDPHHPSLRTRKMEGRDHVFEASANMDIRITFHYEKPDTIVLRNCGHHDDALSKP
ncbi:MAG: cytotoxin [Alicyclobacillus sp.]|nr:cytotoxin [Alicyclobacillus sp.]